MSTVKAVNFQHPSATAVNAATTSGGDLTNAAGVSYMGGSKNLFINGAMNVQQYGSAAIAAPNATSTYRADRWRFSRQGSSAQTYNMEVATDAPSGFPGLKYSTKITVTASASPAADTLDTFGQAIEMQNARVLNSVDFTVSFWVKSSVTGSYTFFLTNGVGDPNRREYQTTYTINAANTWEKKSITVPAKDWNKSGYADNGLGLYVAFTLACGSSRLNTTGWFDGGGEKGGVTGATNLCSTNGATWFVTGVQLEVGPVATSFEFKPFGQELRECQRYYYLHASGTGAAIGTGAIYTSATGYTNVQFPTTMRIGPTVDSSSGSGHFTWEANSAASSFSSCAVLYSQSRSAFVYNAQAISLTAGNAGLLTGTNANTRLAFSAEL